MFKRKTSIRIITRAGPIGGQRRSEGVDMGRRLTWAEEGKWKIHDQAETSSKPNFNHKRAIRIKGDKRMIIGPVWRAKDKGRNLRKEEGIRIRLSGTQDVFEGMERSKKKSGEDRRGFRSG